MDKLSGKQRATARNNNAEMLQGINDVGGNNVAEMLGVNKSTVSRFKEAGGKLDEISELLAMLGLKVAPVDGWICPDGHIPMSISMVLKARAIVADSLGKNSSFIKDCDRGLRRLGIIRRGPDGDLVIPLRYLQ